MFKLYINNTKCGQICGCKANGSSSRVNPNGVIDGSIYNSIQSLTPINNFLNEVDKRNTKRFYLQRTFSLGDLLVLIPVYRQLIKEGYEPYIRTKNIYSDILTRFEINYEIVKHKAEGLGINLDYVVEKDHFTKKLQNMHRVEIYHKILGLKYKKNELDWNMNLKNFPEINYEKPYIIFQGQGAVERRGLPKQTIQELIYLMNLEDIRIIYVGEKIGGLKGYNGLTEFMFMKGSIAELFSYISNAKAIISMDSGPLWISHFTQTPLIAVLGPSRPQERISLHPLYSDGAVGLELNKVINCKACYEQSEKCKHEFSCLKINSEKIYRLMRPKLLEFWR